MSGIGIVAIDIYFPSEYVDQKDLEVHDTVGEGEMPVFIIDYRCDDGKKKRSSWGAILVSLRS
jgi:hypothetical protein